MCDFITEDNSELLSHVKEVHVGSNRKPSHMPNLLTHRGYPQKPEPKTAPPGPVPLVKKPLRPVNKAGGSGKYNRSTNKIDIRSGQSLNFFLFALCKKNHSFAWTMAPHRVEYDP